jgi:hypothetical protein
VEVAFVCSSVCTAPVILYQSKVTIVHHLKVIIHTYSEETSHLWAVPISEIQDSAMSHYLGIQLVSPTTSSGFSYLDKQITHVQSATPLEPEE